MRRVCADLGDYRPVLRAPGLGAWRWEKPLRLASESGVLRIGFWGVGSAFSQNQGQSNIVVMKGDTVVFVDLGSTTTARMAEFGLSVHDIPNLIITHSHADHAGSAEEVGLRGRHEAPTPQGMAAGAVPVRTPLWATESYVHDLWTQTLAGALRRSKTVENNGWQGITDYFDVRHPVRTEDVHGRACWEFTIGRGDNAIEFVMWRTHHLPSDATSWDGPFWSSGYLIDGRIVYSGDTQFDPWLFRAFGDKADIICTSSVRRSPYQAWTPPV